MEVKRYAVFAIIEGLPKNKIPLIQDKNKPAQYFGSCQAVNPNSGNVRK